MKNYSSVDPIFHKRVYINKDPKNTLAEKIVKKKNKFEVRDLKYDTYKDYLKKLSIEPNNDDYLVTSYINIDSSERKKKNSYELESSIVLGQDPIDFKQSSNNIFIFHDSNNFSVGDKIMISGVTTKQKILRTIDGNNDPILETQNGWNFIKVYISHNYPLDYVGTDLTVTFSEIRGDRTQNELGGIPLNVVNTTFIVRLTLLVSELDPSYVAVPGYLDPSPDYFFILLPQSFTLVPLFDEYNFKAQFNSLGGISIKNINANSDSKNKTTFEYHTIKTRFTNGYTVDLSSSATIDERGGGNLVTVKKIIQVVPGYPKNNNYVMDLGKSYENIYSARLVSIDFPNTQPVIRNNVNNKLYWQDIDDSMNIYCLAVPEGIYTPEQLKLAIENLSSEVLRKYVTQTTAFSAKHFFTVSINQNTNKVTISSFKRFDVEKPIVTVEPTISTNVNDNTFPLGTTFLLTLNVPKHGITKTGTEVTISGAIEHLGISPSILNAVHKVETIVDQDNFKIRLPKLNLATTVRTNSKGGNSVIIFIPDKFRILFDKKDSIGSVLGFRDIGEINSITPFKESHSNTDRYINEETDTDNNSIQLSGENYAIMSIYELNGIVNTGAGVIKSFFAKINLCDLPGNIIYGGSDNPLIYENVKEKISSLFIEFKNKDGTYYDFNGIEHSFVLELKTYKTKTEGTKIQSRTSKQYDS